MTITWTNWQTEQELEGERDWSREPARVLDGRTMKIAGRGFAEIKPHSRSGIEDGLEQLAKSDRKHADGRPPMALITYLPIDPSGRPVSTGRAERAKVFAVPYSGPGTVNSYLSKDWYLIGEIPVQRVVVLKVDQPGLFGAAIEERVRRCFRTVVLQNTGLNPGRKFTGGGGPGHGPDVLWNELAAFYRELAAELESASWSASFR